VARGMGERPQRETRVRAVRDAGAHRAGAGGSVPRIKDGYAEGIIVHR
jgi:hypothetical protein